jgi:exodeoxyribonuclease VII large subunit
MSELPVISVTELVTAMKEVIETALPPCIVEAELSNCKRSSAGHWYLTLKDAGAEISATMWRSTADRLKFQPQDGMQVLATGSLQVYIARGTCQFIINRLLPQGVGELELAFRQLQQKLAAEGLFDPGRRRPIPTIPTRIALITSPSGAAVRDMIQVITRRWPPADLVIVPVRVQGEGAVNDLVQALSAVHRIPGVDVAIVGRGGGAVGHETDVSIADLVADRRALTPSEAGELVVPSAEELREQLRQSAERMRTSMLSRVDNFRLRLAALEARSVLQRPENLIGQRRQDCDILGDRLLRSMGLMVERQQRNLAAVAASLHALSPLKVLLRGYSLTRTETGAVVRSASQVQPGDILITRLHEGQLRSRVEV